MLLSRSPASASRRMPGLPVRLDQELRHRPHRPVAALQPVELVLALVEVRHHRDAEGEAGGVDLGRAGVRRVRRDAGPHALRERGSRVLELLLVQPHRLLRVRAEDLQVDDRAQPELGAGMCACARERRVADRGDPGSEALGGPEAGDRLHLVAVDPGLALDVGGEPGRERAAVAETGVDGVLEMGVRIDEARHDRGTGKPLALAERRRRPDRGDPAVLDGDRAPFDRGSFDGEHPVR